MKVISRVKSRVKEYVAPGCLALGCAAAAGAATAAAKSETGPKVGQIAIDVSSETMTSDSLFNEPDYLKS